MDSLKFRVRVLLEDKKRMCFIFINTNVFKTIKDVENHIQKIFKLPQVDLYVGDVLLPSEETISLIYPEDTIIVKKVQCESHRESVVKDEVVELLDELQERKRVLSLEQENMDAMEIAPSDETDSKRKRIRKRSKKKSKESNKCNESLLSFDTDSVKSFEPYRSSRVHIKFDIDDNSNGCNDAPGTSQRNDSPQLTSPTEESPKDWKKKLLKLAKEKERSNKTFSVELTNGTDKNESANGTNLSINHLNPADYPVMTRFPERGDCILFKKLKLDELYNPVHSGYILGSVLCSHAPHVTLKIMEGSEELKDPEGRFSMSNETENNENNLIQRVTLQWAVEVIEPRLVPE